MDLDPEARRVLSLAQEARTPSDDDKARVEKRLALALGAAAIAAPTAVAAKSVAGAGLAKGAGGLLTLKWWLGGVAVLAVAAGGYVAMSQRPASPRPRAPAQVVAARPSAPAATPLPSAQPGAQAVQVDEPAPARAEQAAPRAPQAPRRAQAAQDPLAAELTLLPPSCGSGSRSTARR